MKRYKIKIININYLNDNNNKNDFLSDEEINDKKIILKIKKN